MHIAASDPAIGGRPSSFVGLFSLVLLSGVEGLEKQKRTIKIWKAGKKHFSLSLVRETQTMA
jgi:hypothetical protein